MIVNDNLDVIEFRYILVGNIIDKHFYGENREIRSGTKQFRAGAKVFLMPEYGGMAHENIPVIGLPKNRWKKINITINSNLIKNVRVKKTFDPKLIDVIKECQFYSYFNDEKDLMRLNKFAEFLSNNHKEIDV